MKRALTYVAGIIGLAVCSLAQDAFAQTTASGPYYATPSWDQTLPASTRFVVLSNFNSQAVLDRETGLVWQRAPSFSVVSWSMLSGMCMNATTGGRYGWRLASVQELSSLLDPAATTVPPLPAGHPFLNVFAFEIFWTATNSADTPGYAAILGWFQDPGAPVVVSMAFESKGINNLRGWCVRGGLQSAGQ